MCVFVMCGCMYVCVCNVWMYVCMYVCMCVFVMCGCMYVCVCNVWMYVCVCL
jgi:hypothetical protein